VQAADEPNARRGAASCSSHGARKSARCGDIQSGGAGVTRYGRAREFCSPKSVLVASHRRACFASSRVLSHADSDVAHACFRMRSSMHLSAPLKHAHR
jgi:hypothetical protein